jgi:hypothetical protein
MSRAVVLFLCLASAGAIAGYTHYSGVRGEAPPVFTVPQRVPEPPAKPAATVAPPASIDPADRVALARALQRELKRVGCYQGEINGVWTTSSRMAMRAFTDRVNATLPIDTPDQVLLSLVQGHQEQACGAACPGGQTGENGACVPNAVLVKAKPPAPADGSAAPADSTSAALPAAGVAAALAATAPGAEAKKAPPADTAAHSPAPKPASQPAPEKKAPGERTAPQDGPVPPEGVRERKPRRAADKSTTPRPPKAVRDVLRALGFN